MFNIISPTGSLTVRNDRQGFGYWRAKRGKRLHDGVDLFCEPGQDIQMPLSGEIRIANPYADGSFGGVLIRSGYVDIKIFYFKPFDNLIGKYAYAGTTIGIAQDISERYPPPKDDPEKIMSPHIHVEVAGGGIDPLFIFSVFDSLSLIQRELISAKERLSQWRP